MSNKLPTVEETKIQVASEYGSKDYERDYEYGLGISKLMDPFGFMDRVCESHTAAHAAALRERVKELEERYNRLNANYVELIGENTRYRTALEDVDIELSHEGYANSSGEGVDKARTIIKEALKQQDDE